MTDTEFTALLAMLGGLGSAAGILFRWGVGRIVRAMDDSTNARLLEVQALGQLTAKVEEVHAAVLLRRPYGARPA